MKVEDFFDRFIDGYLMGDLETMSHCTTPRNSNYGGVGYPMVATVIAGMEILGNLLTPNDEPFSNRGGRGYFLNYWNNYLCNVHPEYQGLGPLFRELARNGIAHTFVAKPGILVIKGTNTQLTVDKIKQEICIDCNVFYRDFEDSYNKLIKPIIGGNEVNAALKMQIQNRLDSLSRTYSKDSVKLFSEIVDLNTKVIVSHDRRTFSDVSLISDARNSGASLSIPTVLNSPSLSDSIPRVFDSSSTTTLPFLPENKQEK